MRDESIGPISLKTPIVNGLRGLMMFVQISIMFVIGCGNEQTGNLNLDTSSIEESTILMASESEENVERTDTLWGELGCDPIQKCCTDIQAVRPKQYNYNECWDLWSGVDDGSVSQNNVNTYVGLATIDGYCVLDPGPCVSDDPAFIHPKYVDPYFTKACISCDGILDEAWGLNYNPETGEHPHWPNCPEPS